MKGMVFGIHIYIYIHIRTLVPNTMKGMALEPEASNIGYKDPLSRGRLGKDLFHGGPSGFKVPKY